MDSKLTFSVHIPAQEARANPPLGPILGQHRINMSEFCNEFNKLSSNYSKSVELRVVVIKSKNFLKGYKINIYPPSLAFILDSHFFDRFINFSFFEVLKVDVLSLYDVVRVYSFFHNISLKRSASIVFSYFNSFSLS